MQPHQGPAIWVASKFKQWSLKGEKSYHINNWKRYTKNPIQHLVQKWARMNLKPEWAKFFLYSRGTIIAPSTHNIYHQYSLIEMIELGWCQGWKLKQAYTVYDATAYGWRMLASRRRSPGAGFDAGLGAGFSLPLRSALSLCSNDTPGRCLRYQIRVTYSSILSRENTYAT
jgi:hypothetical protein